MLTIAAIAAALILAPAASAGDSTEHGVDRARLAAKAEQVIEKKRGIEVKKISRCGPAKRKGKLEFSRWVCAWRAEGIWPGEVPYHCAGKARWDRKQNRWRVDRCRNRLQPQAPLLDQPNPHPLFGYNDDWIFHGNAALDLADEGGAQIVRIGINWSGIEGSPGNFNWFGPDALYEKLTARGIRPLWLVYDAPCWAQPDPGSCEGGQHQLHPAPQFHDEFARFAVTVAKRYPGTMGIEVWNEPNYPRFWGGRPDPLQYSNLLKAVAGAIHREVPGVPVISAGVSPHADTDPNAIGFRNFLLKMYKYGAAQEADAIGIHPYPGVGPTQDYIGDVRVYLGKVQRVLRRYHDSDTPLWATEFGVSTTGPHAFDAAHQGRALVELYEMMRRVHKIELAVVHRFVENPALGGREAGFGVVGQNLSPKPSYCDISRVRGVTPGSC